MKLDIVYKGRGIRTPSELINPRINPWSEFTLPFSSAYHFSKHNELAPRKDTSYLHKLTVKAPLVTVTKYIEPVGGVKQLTKNIRSVMLPAVRASGSLKLMLSQNNLQTLSKTVPVIYTYGMLEMSNKYSPNMMTPYYKWSNKLKTVVLTANKSIEDTFRTNFIPLYLPTDLPTRAILKKHSGDPTAITVKELPSQEALNLLDVWKFIDPDTRENSLLNGIDPKNYAKTILVFIRNGRYTMLSLAHLDSFIKGTGSEDDVPKRVKETEVTVRNTSTLDHTTIQRNLLLMAFRIGSSMLGLDGDAEVAETLTSMTDQELDIVDELITSSQVTDGGMMPVVDDPSELVSVPTAPDTVLNDIISDNKSLTPLELKRYGKILTAQSTAPDPYGTGGTLEEAMTITTEDIDLPEDTTIMADSIHIPDKSMLKSSLNVLDKQYIENVMSKDMTNVVMSIQKAGIIVDDYTVTKHTSIQGDYEEHIFKAVPVGGKPKLIKLRVPTVKADGTYMVGGISSRLRRQRVDVPIRKINHNQVGLISNYGKLFIDRSKFKKDDYSHWLMRQIFKLAGEDGILKSVIETSETIDYSDTKLTRSYTNIARYVQTFIYQGIKFVFNPKLRLGIIGGDKDKLDRIEKEGIFVGITGGKNNRKYYVMTDTGEFKLYGGETLGTVEEMLNINTKSAPVEFSSLKIFTKNIPVGVVMGYYIGFTNLLKLMDAKYRIVENPTRPQATDDEYVIKFMDVSVVLNRLDYKTSMIFGGFNVFKDYLVNQPMNELNNKLTYTAMLSSKEIGNYFIKEMDILDTMFIDHITQSELKKMGEPETFRGLLVRASELLLSDFNPVKQDTKYMLFKSYERIPGMMYKTLITHVKEHKYKSSYGDKSFNVDPYGVWKTLVSDNSNIIVSDLNPVDYLKQVEDTTYTGVGGIGKESITKDSRAYHISDIGIISEATKDTGDVGVNAYLSANPNITSLRGHTGEWDIDKDGVSSILSPSALLAPGSTNDDPKRVNFVSIQNSHTVPIVGQETPYIRTGYEYVMPHRLGKKFALMAKDDGVVTKLTKNGIIITYKDGTTDGAKLGGVFTKEEGGITYEHSMVTSLVKGSKFKQGDAIAYNDQFFGVDVMSGGNLVYMVGKTLRMAITETLNVHEDSCALSSRVLDTLATEVVNVKQLAVDFDKELVEIVSIGDKVKPETMLLMLSDKAAVGSGLSSASLNVLRNVTSETPTADHNGVITNISVRYNGDVEDMSPSLKDFVTAYDAKLSRNAKAIGDAGITGRVTSEYRVRGKALLPNQLEIKIYVKVLNIPGTGDKCIFSNQLKSTIGEVITNTLTTPDGTPIDGLFGHNSVEARIVPSFKANGTAITLLKVIGMKAVAIYSS